MNDFDSIEFSQDNLEQTNSFSSLPFEEPKTIPQTQNNIIIMDDRIKDIPPLTKSEKPIITDNNIIILDDKIKNIPAKNSKISFKKASIIFPIIAFTFVSILVMYIFINNSKAEVSNLIRIEDNSKVGYIDNEGTIIVRPKYSFGSEYYKGLAIVKNDNNLYGLLNGKGVLQVPFGNYYSINLTEDRYIASKITSSGLKYALLDNKLSEVTRFKYDNITYSKSGVYSFVREETMGLLNSKGKEVYTFKVDEVDDKKIEVEVSEVDESVPIENRYAKVKVNKSSLIINLSTGKEVFGYTLEDINVLNNNVFYIKAATEGENSTYIVVNDGKVKYKTDKYSRIRVDDVDSNIAICINNDTSVDYINLDNQSVINNSENNTYTYGSGLVLEKVFDMEQNKDVYKILSSKKELGSFTDYVPTTGIFSNSLLKVKSTDEKYYFINETGNPINSTGYDDVSDFNKLGYATVSMDNNYGIINSKGKVIVDLKYFYVDFLNEKLHKMMKENYNKELFVIKNETGNYGLIDSKNNIVLEPKYQQFEYVTEEYPFVMTSVDNKKILINIDTMKEVPIELSSNSPKITENYIFDNNNYYNYKGELLYSIK